MTAGGGRRGRERWLKLALAAIATFSFLLLLELLGWALGIPLRADDHHAKWRHRMHECRFGRGHVEQACDPGVLETPPGTLPIAILGGSTVEGYPFGTHDNFPRLLGEVLESRRPNEYRVHNLGRSCKESSYVRACAERAMQGNLEILIVYAGHNDFGTLMVERPRMELLFASFPWLIDLEGWLSRRHSFALWVSLAARLAPPAKEWHRLTEPEFTRRRDWVLERYTENLEAVLEGARERGIPVILVTLVSNLYEFPFRREQWSEVASLEIDAHLRSWQRAYLEGIELDGRGRRSEALSSFKRARDELMKSRAPSVLNQRLRDLAAERPGVSLVDFEVILDEIGLEEGIGCTFFGAETWCDQFHPNPRTSRMIAEALAEAVLGLRRAPA
ncbi:MAG: hypothetical protein ABFS46_08930, partial [Myxococcota bacterium]